MALTWRRAQWFAHDQSRLAGARTRRPLTRSRSPSSTAGSTGPSGRPSPEALWVTGEIRTIKVLAKGHCFIDLVDPTHAQDSGAPTLNVKCWSTQWRSVRSTLDGLGITLDAGMVVRARGAGPVLQGPGHGRLHPLRARHGRAPRQGRRRAGPTDQGARGRGALRPPTAAARPRAPAPGRPGGQPGHRGLQRLHRRPARLGHGLRGHGRLPTTVQGKGAPAKVAAAISSLQTESLDLIVVVRGGGSKADLAAFDQERGGTGHRHVGRPGLDRYRPHRRPVGRRRGGQSLLHHPHRVRPGDWPVWPPSYWRQVEESGGACWPAWPTSRSWWPTGSWPPANGPWPPEPATSSTAMATGSATGPDTFRGVSGVSSTPIGLGCAPGARPWPWPHDALCRARGASLLTGRSRRLAGLPERQLVAEDRRIDQWRRLLGAYDYQRQLERGYSVTRDASGQVVRSVSGIDSRDAPPHPGGRRRAGLDRGGDQPVRRPRQSDPSGNRLGNTTIGTKTEGESELMATTTIRKE